MGSYPEVSLKDARAARDDARKQHQAGADPVLAPQVDRLSSRFDANASFEVTAREFHATKRVGWSDHYAKRWLERLGKDIFPWLGKLPLSQIGAPMLLQTLAQGRSPWRPGASALAAGGLQPGVSIRRVDGHGKPQLPRACTWHRIAGVRGAAAGLRLSGHFCGRLPRTSGRRMPGG